MDLKWLPIVIKCKMRSLYTFPEVYQTIGTIGNCGAFIENVIIIGVLELPCTILFGIDLRGVLDIIV